MNQIHLCREKMYKRLSFLDERREVRSLKFEVQGAGVLKFRLRLKKLMSI